MSVEPRFSMSITLNVLSNLGTNLYSNIPAVLSEAIANCWDADADDVKIKVDNDNITIIDNGQGMTESDINAKFLTVGFEKRNDVDYKKINNQVVTPKYNRPLMGRKGIGKLSLFSIADTIEILTFKNGEKNGFIMSASEIESLIKKNPQEIYHPTEVEKDKINLNSNGTIIKLSKLKKKIVNIETSLKKRISRRFSIIGEEYKFNVSINDNPISITDRDYFHKIQYIWRYGETPYEKYCKDNLKETVKRDDRVSEDRDFKVYGWIGSVVGSGELKDPDENLNKIIIMSRGKLAQENILEDFTEGGLYTKYLLGEINADFIDIDTEPDLSTSSRQDIIKDDERYKLVKEWIGIELKHIQSKWTDLRTEDGTNKALEIPAINKWFQELKPDSRKEAKKLFGKINQLTLDSDESKKELLSASVLAFENFRYKENLQALDKISPEQIEAFSKIFLDLDDIEATLYHQIIKGRLGIIEKLQEGLENNDLEKVMQKHLYEHLWLLDPSWERATETPFLESTVSKEFGKIDVHLNEDERKGRFDIKYKKTSGKHVIIELKRSNRSISSYEIIEQVVKYRDALRKILESVNQSNEPIEVVCIVGTDLKDWTSPKDKEESKNMLWAKQIRVILYQELVENAYKQYIEFINKHKESGRIYNLIQNIKQ